MSGVSFKSGSWLLLDNLCQFGAAFGFFVVSARILTPLEFGIAALALSVSQLLASMIESLFHDALIQREELESDDIQTAFTATLIWAVALSALLVLASPLIARGTGALALERYLPWMSLAALSSGLLAVPAALARRRMEFRALAIRTILARTIATVAGLALIFDGFAVWGVIVQAIAQSMLSALFVVIVMRPSFRLLIDRDRLGALLRFASASMGTQLLLYSSSRAFTLLVSGLLGPVQAALWTVALRFVEPLQLMAATTVGQFSLPIYARKQTDPAALHALFFLGVRRSSLLLVPIFVGLGACAGPTIDLFVGPQWLAAEPLMAIMSLVFAVVASRQLVEITLTSLGAPHLNLIVQAVAILLSFAGFAMGAPNGLVAAAIGWSLRALPFITLAAWFLLRRARISLGAQMMSLAPIYAASGLMALAVIALQRTILLEQTAIVRLIGSMIAGMLVYAAAAFLLDRHTRSDLAAIRLSRRSAGAVAIVTDQPPLG